MVKCLKGKTKEWYVWVLQYNSRRVTAAPGECSRPHAYVELNIKLDRHLVPIVTAYLNWGYIRLSIFLYYIKYPKNIYFILCTNFV